MNQLEVMNFLNEVANDFPSAISLAAGRPNPKFFNREKWEHFSQGFTEYFANKSHISIAKANERLCEYGPASGLINSLISKHLEIDENITTDEKDIVITNGCQEALTLVCLNELIEPSDCMLVVDPSYIGFSGLIKAIGKKVFPLEANKLFYAEERSQRVFNISYIKKEIDKLLKSGLNPKALYINPDFNNPLAYRLNLHERSGLLDFCHQHEIKIVEDNPYARFNYSDKNLPSIKSLDNHGIVYHIGSFSKTFSPAIRLGYLVLPNNDLNDRKKYVALKSLVSVNTSSTSQSIIGGFLLKNKLSLDVSMSPIIRQYEKQRDAMTQALNEYFGKYPEVTWQVPEGGFFMVVNLPFSVNHDDVFECAKDVGMIFMPVSFFAIQPKLWSDKVRLSFSFYSPEEIREGIRRFALFLSGRLKTKPVNTAIQETNCV